MCYGEVGFWNKNVISWDTRYVYRILHSDLGIRGQRFNDRGLNFEFLSTPLWVIWEMACSGQIRIEQIKVQHDKVS